jgi:PhzF family phenazine biosynthesis protein
MARQVVNLDRLGVVLQREFMMAAPVPLFLVDAFAERPFAGNPAAVCLLQRWPADAWLQAVAAEMNQSETAFLVPQPPGWSLRWFTPAVEVDLCGHATLASAFVLWHAGRAERGTRLAFQTRSGALSARAHGELIELDFPLDPVSPSAAPAGLLESLGCGAKFVGRGRFDYLVELDSEAAVRGLSPDFRALSQVDCRGVIATTSGRGRFDFVSRFFAPAAGIDEDPVTGSAHCTLAAFWSQRLGRGEMRGYQASRRGGVVEVAVDGQRVLLRGRAILTAHGELAVAPDKA